MIVCELVVTAGAARRILDGVNFVLPPDGIMAVTGPSGAGKTTLLHAVAGLARPQSGSIAWDAVEIGALPEAARDRWRRETVGLVLQEFQLFAELGVLENILLPVRFDHWRTPPSLLARATDLAERVGLDPRGRRAGLLSRGEQQRLAIARALLRRPSLVLADEPTASLDAENAARIGKLLTDTVRESGASLLLVSHDRTLIALADATFRLEAGRLLPSGDGPS